MPSLLRPGSGRSAAGELALAAGAGFVVQAVVPEDGLLVLGGQNVVGADAGLCLTRDLSWATRT
ncbi:hypothetical protein [Actinomadura latina]|uniref:hypothetical protein n=1 Tax=Actinomadura latina TaxID=163603 RepID=UPI0008298E77|nr:hypothetical protein [Actinomadura latina]